MTAVVEEIGPDEWDMKVQWLDVAQLHPNLENPNEQDDATFNDLVQSIQTDGWTVPVQVVEIATDAYEIVSGEHRWRAAKVLQCKVPAIVLPAEQFDQDRRDWALVKDNMLKGKLNPEKFTRLYSKLVQKYDADVLKTLMGFTSEDAFRKVFRETKAGLSPEMQAALEESKEEIKTIDDLSRVLNKLFIEHGETLPSNMMVFSFGGRDVLWIRAEKELWKLVKGMADKVAEDGLDMAAVMFTALQHGQSAAMGAPVDNSGVQEPAEPGAGVPEFTHAP